VFFSVLEDGKILALNYSEQSADIALEGEFSQTLPPYSIEVLKPLSTPDPSIR
jgi:hypothetical protein